MCVHEGVVSVKCVYVRVRVIVSVDLLLGNSRRPRKAPLVPILKLPIY